jgi:ATP-dependent protease HslVU (ClpYQ) peptidase subunit
MTTIAFKNGVIAADSRVTVESEAGGARNFDTRKLFRAKVDIKGTFKDVILATAGESAPGSLFVEQWSTGKSLTEIRELFTYSEADFTILVVTEDGLFEVDKWCILEPVYEPFYAIGSGSKLAMGAMEAGASAQKAVEIACKRDPYTALPVVTMRLKPNANQKSRTPMPEVSITDDDRRQTRRPNAMGLPRKRRQRGSGILLHHDQSAQGPDQKLRQQPAAHSVQSSAEQVNEAVHHNGSAERDTDS